MTNPARKLNSWYGLKDPNTDGGALGQTWMCSIKVRARPACFATRSDVAVDFSGSLHASSRI